MNKIINVLQRLFSLLVVFLMLSATTITAGRFFGHEWRVSGPSPVGQNEVPERELKTAVMEPDEAQMDSLGIPDACLVARDSISWTVMSADGEPCGILLSSQTIGKDIEGFGGRTPLFVLIGTDDRISALAVGQNDETPYFLSKAADAIFPKWVGTEAGEALDVELDAVSGATYSSNALIGNMKKAVAAYTASQVRIRHAPAIGWGKTIAVLLMLTLGILAACKFRGKKWWRIGVLALNVGVTGFWCGQFLSLSILHGWMLNGFDVVTVLPTFVMLLVALVMPYLGRHNHFCTWVCPYGSLQELVWYIPVKKLHLKSGAMKWMGRVRTSVFIVLMALLWLGWGTSLLNYEPFGAFLVNAAAPAVMILAGTFVVLAIFIPRPWCKTFCPVGELLHLAETPISKRK